MDMTVLLASILGLVIVGSTVAQIVSNLRKRRTKQKPS